MSDNLDQHNGSSFYCAKDYTTFLADYLRGILFLTCVANLRENMVVGLKRIVTPNCVGVILSYMDHGSNRRTTGDGLMWECGTPTHRTSET